MGNTGSPWVVGIVALIVGIGIGYFMWGIVDFSSTSTTATSVTTTTSSSAKQIALHSAMRKLWSDHAWWTREYINTVASGNKAAGDAAAARLLKNQEDIGNAAASYYGTAAGNKLTTLLKEHITIAVDLLAAAKANDTAKFNDANARWKKNGDDIAVFLSQANPNWPEAALKDMMAKHLQTTTEEVTAALKGDHIGSVSAFDKVFDHINMMADTLSAGIIKQFPDKFK